MGWNGYEEYFEFVIKLFLKDYKDLIIKAFPNYSNEIINISYEETKTKMKNVIPNASF